MLCALLLSSLVSASPTVGVTVSNSIGTPTGSTDWLALITDELQKAQVDAKRMKTPCAGEAKCLLKLTAAEGHFAVVSLTIAYGKKETTLDLEAIRVRDGTGFSQVTFKDSSALSTTSRALLAKLAGDILKLPEAMPVIEKKEPVAVVLTPKPKEEPVNPIVVLPSKPMKSVVPGVALGAGAIAVAVVSAVFLGIAMGQKTTIDKARASPNSITKSEAEKTAADANGNFSISLGTGIGAAALAVGSTVWFVTE
jgi:hypothetical protein